MHHLPHPIKLRQLLGDVFGIETIPSQRLEFAVNLSHSSREDLRPLLDPRDHALKLSQPSKEDLRPHTNRRGSTVCPDSIHQPPDGDLRPPDLLALGLSILEQPLSLGLQLRNQLLLLSRRFLEYLPLQLWVLGQIPNLLHHKIFNLLRRDRLSGTCILACFIVVTHMP